MTTVDRDILRDSLRTLTAPPRVLGLLCYVRQTLYRNGMITLDEYATLATLAHLIEEPPDSCRPH